MLLRRHYSLKSKKTISIFISHQGCPNDCVFCNQRKITGIEDIQDEKEIIYTINKQLETIEASEVEIAFFGGSFTAINIERQVKLLEIAKGFIDSKKVDYIRISTRPDAINEEILKMLKNYGVRIIELGVQSLDSEVLIASKRGHDASCVYDSSELIKKFGFKLGLQMMIGLPKDNINKVKYTVNEFIKIKPDFVRIYPVVVIRDTELEEMFYNNTYKEWEINDVFEIAKDSYVKFIDNDIDVIRIGLQSSDNIAVGKDIVAGSFHPSFGEIVYSLVYRDKIEQYIKNNLNKDIIIYCNKSKISQIVGNNKMNKAYFWDKYNKNIKIVEDNSSVVKVNETIID